MNIGIIGVGNMGEAVLAGLLKSSKMKNHRCFVHDKNTERMDLVVQELSYLPESLERRSEEPAVRTVVDLKQLVADCDLIFLLVKPDIYPVILAEIAPYLTPKKVLLSIAPGFTFAKLRSALGQDFANIVLFMSNTAAKIGQATTAACFDPAIPENMRCEIEALFRGFGKFFEVRESQLPMITSLIGSSPAIVYMLLESLMQAAVWEGLPAHEAQEMVANVVLSSALMLQSGGSHPALERDRICSPGGTTIEGVAYLEKSGFGGQVMEAVHRMTMKAEEMA